MINPWCAMALFKYFQRSDFVLSNPEGPLSTVVPASGIKAANAEVKPVLEAGASRCGTYLLVDMVTSDHGVHLVPLYLTHASLRLFLTRVW